MPLELGSSDSGVSLLQEGSGAPTLDIGSFLRVFSNSQAGPLLRLSSSEQVSHPLVIDLQEAARPQDNTHCYRATHSSYVNDEGGGEGGPRIGQL